MVRTGIIIVLLLLFIGAFIIFLITHLPFVQQTADSTEVKRDKVIIKTQDIIEDPVVYDGLTIELEEKITDWVTKRAFLVGGGEGLLSPSGLLVMRREEFSLPLENPGKELTLGEEAEVVIKGRVSTFNIKRFEDNWGVDLQDDELRMYEERPVLIITEIEKK